MGIDVSYRARRLAERLEDPDFRAEYERSQREIAQVDTIMQVLDELRADAGLSKATLARSIGRNPASVRRWFTSEVNPELKIVVAMADALDAEILIRPRRRRRQRNSGAVPA